ncbi:MAG: sigma-70 family RNA polymerase sigma factor [Chthoniobacterales bacterium]|nr:sigma-70 family RNA polymerase sigma factor [Chthoniobacterales bacterium]MBA3761911.1 sigma-70 family RNA polymerase sigma factor [Chthoniobacterales bacterium]
MIAPALDSGSLSFGPSDESLMQSIVDRKDRAIAALYDRHAKTLKKIIYQVLQDDAEADDVLQESILQIWKEAGSYSAALGKPLGWLVTIARRRAIDRVRRRSAYARAKDRFELYVETEPRSWLRSCTDEDTSAADIRHFLETEIERLPEYQAEAVKLSFFSGLSHREIAAKTGTPLGTVKTRLELGLRKLSTSVRAQRSKI